jgi:hypothetical protein
MSLTVQDGATITKDPVDAKVYVFDWDAQHLGSGVEITGTPTVTPVAISGDTTTTPLTVSNVSLLTGNRKVQFRANAGAVGSKWRLDCQIVTNETPAQTIERSVFVLVEQR